MYTHTYIYIYIYCECILSLAPQAPDFWLCPTRRILHSSPGSLSIACRLVYNTVYIIYYNMLCYAIL